MRRKIRIILLTLSAAMCVYFSVHTLVTQIRRYAFPHVALTSEKVDGEYVEKTFVTKGISGYLGKAADLIFGGNFADNTITLAVSGNADVEKTTVLEDAKPTPTPVIQAKSEERNISAAGGKTKLSDKITINNETKYALNSASLMNSEKAVVSKPKVLIVHTHATESYQPDEKYNFRKSENDRNTDNNYNMVGVGDILADELSKCGIDAVHIRTQHDYPQYNNSYSRSCASVESVLKKNPDISIVIDLHRDAIMLKDGTKAKLVTKIDGEAVAQVMLVVGTDELGLKHDNWRTNLKFAVQLQNELLKISPSFPRPINLRTSRFNGHLAPGAVIIEVGAAGNSYSEAAASAKYIAKALSEYINK